MNSSDKVIRRTVQIKQMAPISITISVTRGVRFRLRLFRLLLWLAARSYPGRCRVAYKGTDEEGSQ